MSHAKAQLKQSNNSTSISKSDISSKNSSFQATPSNLPSGSTADGPLPNSLLLWRLTPILWKSQRKMLKKHPGYTSSSHSPHLDGAHNSSVSTSGKSTAQKGKTPIFPRRNNKYLNFVFPTKKFPWCTELGCKIPYSPPASPVLGNN